MRKLYIFNPDHDLALASDSDHFDAPQSAKIFARDFSLLPLWFCSEESAIYTENKEQNPWFIDKFRGNYSLGLGQDCSPKI